MCERSQDLTGEKVQKKFRKTVKDASFRYVICGKNLCHYKDSCCDDGRATCFAASKLTHLADSRLIKSGRR